MFQTHTPLAGGCKKLKTEGGGRKKGWRNRDGGNRIGKDKWRRIGLVKVGKEVEQGRKRENRRGRKKGRRIRDGCNAISSTI